MARTGGIDLGICFNGSFLYYALSDPEHSGHLLHIGSAEMPTDAVQSIRQNDDIFFQSAAALIQSLKRQFNPVSVRIQSSPANECWSAIPRAVYKDKEELEALLPLLMPDYKRSAIEISTYGMSKSDWLMLCLRKSEVTKRYQKLTTIGRESELLADFQLGQEWNKWTGINGSYLFIGSYPGLLTISSYLLGKLRATTFFQYSDIRDIPFFWKQAAEQLSWINGYHEQIYVFGHRIRTVQEQLLGYWDRSADLILLNELHTMDVQAPESTYGFDLAQAFPAIILAMYRSKTLKDA